MKGKTNTEVVISKTENLAAGIEVEIVDVCYGCETYYMCVIPSGVKMTIDARFVDIIDNIPLIDWEQRRYELVKAAMQGFCSNPHEQIMSADSNIVAEWSIGFADSLIKKLKGD